MTPTGATSAAGPAKPRSGIKELTVRGKCVFGVEGGVDVRHLDSGRGDFHGDIAEVPGPFGPGE